MTGRRLAWPLFIGLALLASACGVPAPRCDSAAPFTVSPIALSDLVSITPLGNLNPPAHTFPTSHMYFGVPVTNGPPGTGPMGDGRVPASMPVMAPGKVILTRANVADITSTRSGKAVSYTEYSLDFNVCGGVKINYGHVGPVSHRIAAAIKQAGPPRCQDYATGPDQSHFCSYGLQVGIAAGEQVAFTSGRAFGLDFGAYDEKGRQLAFVHPERYQAEARYNLCPLDLFEPGVHAQLLGRVADFNGQPRTAEPICGAVNQDVAGTAQGNWFKDPRQPNPEDNNLALVHDNFEPTPPVLSVGNSVPGLPSGRYSFALQTSGLINRDFGAISPDGQVYCFEQFARRGGVIVLLTLGEAETLRLEARPAASCGAGPWTLSDGAVKFFR